MIRFWIGFCSEKKKTEKKETVLRKMVRDKAMEIYRENAIIYEDCKEYFGEDKEFSASKGWLNRFFLREGLTLKRKMTHYC
jgi:hypothetical protein